MNHKLKETPAGNIPSDWLSQPFDDVAVIKNGQVDPRSEKHRNKILVAPDHIEEQSGRLLETKTAAEQNAISGKYLFCSEDVVYSKIRPYLKKAIHAEFDGLCSADMYPISARDHIDSRYLFACMLGFRFSAFASTVSARSGIPKINRNELKEFSFPIPSLTEQKSIAKALSDTDALISSLEKLIAKKRAIKTATMQQLLTGKTRLPGFGEGKGYKDTELGRIPEDWSMHQLTELGEFKNGINKSKSDFGFGSPFVNLLDVFGKREIKSDRELGLVNSTSSDKQAYDLRKGDVIFIRSSVKPSGVGLAVLIDEDLLNTVYSGFLIRFRSVGQLEHKFKAYCFSEAGFRSRVISASSVSANTNINQDNLKRIVIPIPSCSYEQKAIASVLSELDSSIESLLARVKKTMAIKSTMMQQLLTGRTRLK